MLVKLSDICNITMGQSPKSIYYNTSHVGLPFMQGCTTFGRIYPHIDTWTSSYNKIANLNDILFTVRAPVGDVNISNQKIAIGRGLSALTSTTVNYKYLFYLLLANKDKFTLNSTGTVYESINKNTLENTLIEIHSQSKQLHIVDIIGSLDDKIENNNKIIENLNKFLNIKTNELIIYKTTKIKLEKILSEEKEKVKQEYTPYSVISTGKVVIQDEQFNKQIATNTTNKYKLIKKDYFVYNPSRINIGSIGIMDDEYGCVSPIYTVFTCNDKYKYYFQRLLNFESMKLEINKRCSGSVRQALSFTDMCSIEIYDVDLDQLNKYNYLSEKINMVIKKFEYENKLLEKQKQNYLSKFF